MRLLRTFLRLVLALLLIVVVLAGIWWLRHRDEARAWRQALVVASQVEQVPVLTRVAGVITDEPRAQRSEQVATLPATLILPSGDRDSWPALVIVVPNGTSTGELATLARAQRGLARAGMAAWAVRAPDIGQGFGNAADTTRLTGALAAIAADPRTRDGEISVAAGGPQASQVLVAAAGAPLRDRIAAVVAVQPIADVQGVLRLAVTGTTRGTDGVDRPHPAGAVIRDDAGRALVAVLRAQPAVRRSQLLTLALDRAARTDDPIGAVLRVPPVLLTGNLQAAQAALSADTPEQFDAAWAQLPQAVRDAAMAESPLPVASAIRARVLLLVPENDSRYPAADAERLADAMRRADVEGGVRFVRSAALDASGSADSSEVRRLLGVSAWWLRRAGA